MRLYTILKNIINTIKSISTTVKGISNKYYYKTGSITGTVNATNTVCTLSNLPKGIYLVLGGIDTTVDSGSTALQVTFSATNITFTVASQGRGTSIAGGGTQGWALANVTSATNTLNLRSYRYYSGTITYRGKLLAIKLI